MSDLLRLPYTVFNGKVNQILGKLSIAAQMSATSGIRGYPKVSCGRFCSGIPDWAVVCPVFSLVLTGLTGRQDGPTIRLVREILGSETTGSVPTFQRVWKCAATKVCQSGLNPLRIERNCIEFSELCSSAQLFGLRWSPKRLRRANALQ